MIRDVKKWQEWEDAYNRAQPTDFMANLRYADAILEHARALGVFPPKDPLDGLGHKLRVARIINCSPNSYKERPKS